MNIKNISVREKAYTIIREAIIKGVLSPGERLIEESLANEYNVSRTPLREAIHKLELDGFLKRLPSRGLIVSEISLQEVRELYQVRSVLEGLATRVVTQNLSEKKYNELLEIKNKAVEFRLTNNITEALSNCARLHNFIRTNCNQAVCVTYLEKMNMHIQRYREIGVKKTGRVEEAYNEHMSIIDFILCGDHNNAENTMRNHVEKSGLAVVASLKQEIEI
jgi:Transcriptional regulators